MNRWYKVAIFNLVILAFLGFVLRYKINFPLEFVEQKKLLHAHSHFAFSGWISFLLQLLGLHHFTNLYKAQQKTWDGFFLLSVVVNYGMIFSFAMYGYSLWSIVLSTASLFLSYFFCYKVYRDLRNNIQAISTRFIMASLFFLVLSSLGPYTLAAIMLTKNTDQYFYHNALYFFLHFQYNGWFTFAILGFLLKKIELGTLYSRKTANTLLILLALTCIPGNFLTTLWHKMPVAVIVINVITALVQLVALWLVVVMLYRNMKTVYSTLPVLVKWMYSLAIAAFVLKTVLQCFSAHPQIGQLAFAYRSIIIGYLHLIFLVFVSIYMLGILAEAGILPLQRAITRWGLIVFSASVVVNEILLGVQGVMSIFYIFHNSVNMLLFLNTIIILAGAIMLFLASLKSPAESVLRVKAA
jgi:hypothetical protein